jgi:mono/diheme cytochrome c family protein
MAIIVGILGYMMQSGTWIHNESFWGAFFNPLYLPQLAFRTFFALMLAGVFFMFLTPFFTKAGSNLRRWAIQLLGFWTLFWWIWAALSAFNYWYKVPELMKSNTPVAIATQQFTTWYDVILIMLLAAVVTVLIVALWGVIWPRRMPAVVAIIPFCLAIVLVGYFERVREFIRKPYVIEEYLYSNGLRVQDYPLFKEQGILPYSTYVANSIITPENEIDAGRDVFMVSCTRCHTASGANSITRRFSLLYGEEPWDKSNVASFISGMHNVRYFMPPFPGNDAELQALAAYIVKLQQKPERLFGAQEVGVSINSSN